jgi:phosphoribosyl 1,2-cyclic phosphate phosphodiesterase
MLLAEAMTSNLGEVASLKFHIIQNDPFYVQELVVVPIPVEHGKIGSAPFWSLGFRFDNFTYISDVSGVPPKSKSLILGSEILVVDALQVACHLSHFSRDEACALIKELVPNGKGYLTGISHKMEHEELQSWLLESYPQIKCAYDGLCIKF